jgi:hypothetical protein
MDRNVRSMLASTASANNVCRKFAGRGSRFESSQRRVLWSWLSLATDVASDRMLIQSASNIIMTAILGSIHGHHMTLVTPGIWR